MTQAVIPLKQGIVPPPPPPPLREMSPSPGNLTLSKGYFPPPPQGIVSPPPTACFPERFLTYTGQLLWKALSFVQTSHSISVH